MVSSPTSQLCWQFQGPIQAFVGQYLCSARHKQNISTLQNIKMRDNESLREFVKRFGQAVLQIEACSMDVVLQIFKRSICPSTPFFESLAKKPPTTMDDLFKRANKYSMLEDDVRAATQQVMAYPTSGGLNPSERIHPQETVAGDISVERLIKAGHLKQYLARIWGRDVSKITTQEPLGPQYPTRILQPHRDAIILSLEIGDFDVRRILVDPGSSADLVQASVVDHMGHGLAGLENPGRILSGFNGSSTISLGDIILPVQAGPVTLNVQFSVVQDIIGAADKDPPAADPLQTIQISEESTHLTNISSLMTQEETQSMQNILRRNHDIFAWTHSDMKGIHPSIASHKLNVFPAARPVRQKIRRFHRDRQKVIRMRLTNC
ncbi:hypothetical protein AAG906_011274 [Vitis piasezkii]